MRFFLSVLLIILFSAIATYFLPWWSLAIVAFIVAMLMKLKPGKGFLAGFLAIFLLWGLWALAKDAPNHHVLAERLAKLFSLPGHIVFILVAALTGGITGGLAAWSGALLRRSAV